jgi:hypothetical protein
VIVDLCGSYLATPTSATADTTTTTTTAMASNRRSQPKVTTHPFATQQ